MKENIILIVTDDQTINTIKSKGNSEIITPNLDSLCDDGIYFNNCNIDGGTSGAICMPSRAVLNTSQDLFKFYDAGNTIPQEFPLLGEELSKLGYETFFTGKWHNGFEAFKRSFTAGDNIFFGGMWDHYNVPMNKFDPAGEYDNKVNCVVNFFNASNVLEMHANKFNPGIHSTDVITDSAIKFIKEYNSKSSFYLNVAYLAPHDPRVVPQKYLDMYRNLKVSIPRNFKYKHPFNFGQEHERDEQLAPKPFDMNWYLNQLKTYYAMITHLDDEIGKIIKTLKEDNLYEQSIIIFTSDNGLTIGSHGLMGKQNLYNESINVPLIMKLPRNCEISNQERNQLVTLKDLFPTILELIGEQVPRSIDGCSFKNVIVDNSQTIQDELYLAFTEYIRGLQTIDYKLIKYRPTTGVEINQLFYIGDNKLEIENLYDDPKYRQVRTELELRLLDLKQKYEKYNNPYTELFWSKYE